MNNNNNNFAFFVSNLRSRPIEFGPLGTLQMSMALSPHMEKKLPTSDLTNNVLQTMFNV